MLESGWALHALNEVTRQVGQSLAKRNAWPTPLSINVAHAKCSSRSFHDLLLPFLLGFDGRDELE